MRRRRRSDSAAWCAATILAVATSLTVSRAHADDVEGLWRVSASIGGGMGVRVRQNEFLGQERRSPAYLEGRFEALVPSLRRFRHGPTIALATGLEDDGPLTGATRALTQWVLEPGWRLRWHLGGSAVLPIAVVGVAVGIPVVITPVFSAGLAASLRATWMLTSGIGLGLDLAYSVVVGAEDRLGRTTLSSLVAASLVLVLEMERLP
jgi:hypothetical protein